MVDSREIKEMAKFLTIMENSGSLNFAETTPASSSMKISPPASSTVSAAERDQMKKLRAIVEGTPDAVPSIDEVALPVQSRRKSVDDNNVENMLAKFYSASESFVAESESDRQLRRALSTEKTSNGVRVGSWEIISNAGERKTWNIRHIKTKDEIASDLCVYEAAQALVHMLNDGRKINDPEVKEVLALEEQYARNLSDAVSYRRVLRAGSSTTKQAVLEDRFENARGRAANALSRLKRILETR